MTQPDIAPDMKAILAQHRRTYTIDTSAGRIVLRHLRRLDAERVSAVLVANVPGYARAMKELGELSEIAQFVKLAPQAPPMTDAQKERMQALLEWSSPYMDEFAICCFIQPEITTREELEALANALEPKEWNHLQGLLAILGNTRPSFEDRELAFLNRLTAYGIPLAKDLTGEDLTFDQSRALEQASDLEEVALSQVLGGE